MEILKKMTVVFLVIALSICLTSCGESSVSRKNPDGTLTRIKYKSAVPLQRAPYFELSDSTVKMSFNGTIWYEASIINAAVKDWAAEGEFICESSNIKVYKANQHAKYDYAYVLTLTGTSDSYILFYSNDSPDQGSYGNDFDVSIRYFVDNTETVPDLDFR